MYHPHSQWTEAVCQLHYGLKLFEYTVHNSPFSLSFKPSWH